LTSIGIVIMLFFPQAMSVASWRVGRLAQLGERCLRKAEAGSSNLLPSTRKIKGIEILSAVW
jgi:hypothetical protein